MARELTFKIKDSTFIGAPTKIERKKLYGWTETLAMDEKGNECKLVNMDESGTHILPKGGVALGILAPDGAWVERSQLKAVYADGTPAVLLPSSYGIEIELSRKATPEEYLDHNIKSFYQLDEVSDEFIEAIGDDIYTFTYSYRDEYEGSNAFVMVAEDGDKGKKAFMMVGIPNTFEMLTLEELAVVEEDVDEEESGDDEIDFSMF